MGIVNGQGYLPQTAAVGKGTGAYKSNRVRNYQINQSGAAIEAAVGNAGQIGRQLQGG